MVKYDFLRTARLVCVVCALGGGLAPIASSAASFSQQVNSVNFTVNFDFDTFDLSAETRRELDAQAEWMLQHGKFNFSILGFADRVGSATYNHELAMSRAIQVASYLVQRGVNPDRLSALVSYGSEVPAIETELAERANRRVVILATRPAENRGFRGLFSSLTGRTAKAGNDQRRSASYWGDRDDRPDGLHPNEGGGKAPAAESGGTQNPGGPSGGTGQPSADQQNENDGGGNGDREVPGGSTENNNAEDNSDAEQGSGQGSQGNNGFGNGDQDAPGGSADNNNAENDSDAEQGSGQGSQGNNGNRPDAPGNKPDNGPQGNNGHGNGDQDAPGGSADNNNAENG